jgi:predicted aspartyl protease
MRRFAVMALAVAALGCWAAGSAQAACQIKQFGDFPLRPVHRRALIEGEINGKHVLLIADTGSRTSMIWRAAAVQLGAPLEQLRGVRAYGIGGRTTARVTNVDLQIRNYHLPKEAMMVFDSDWKPGHGAALIGMDLLGQRDLELDLPDHAIRLLAPEGCKGAEVAYWLEPGKPYSQVRLEGDNLNGERLLLTVQINGRPVLAELDSGSPTTILTPQAASEAGISLSPGTAAGETHGLGPRSIASQIVDLGSFTIGDETIKDTKVMVADLFRYNTIDTTGTRLGSEFAHNRLPLMLLGADFLDAHRMLIARSQNMIYFTYLGGPVFDLTPPPSPSTPAPDPSAPAPGTPAQATPAQGQAPH